LFADQHHQTGATEDSTRPQGKRATKEYLEKRSGERNVDRQQDISTAGGRWKRQYKIELDGWSDKA